MIYETIKVEIENSLCWIGLNRKEARNAINKNMCLEITDAVQQAIENKHVHVIVIHGKGRCFSAGGDLKAGIPSPSEEVLETVYKPMLLSVFNSVKPVICMVHAYAIGVASALAMSADFLFMSEDAYIRYPFVDLGLIPDGGLSWHLVNQIGRKKALEIIVSGEKIYADDCATMGIANRIIPKDELVTTTQQWADLLVAKAPLAVRYAKQSLNKSMELTLGDAISYEASLQNITMLSADSREATRAFIEKREPQFKGK